MPFLINTCPTNIRVDRERVQNWNAPRYDITPGCHKITAKQRDAIRANGRTFLDAGDLWITPTEPTEHDVREFLERRGLNPRRYQHARYRHLLEPEEREDVERRARRKIQERAAAEERAKLEAEIRHVTNITGEAINVVPRDDLPDRRYVFLPASTYRLRPDQLAIVEQFGRHHLECGRLVVSEGAPTAEEALPWAEALEPVDRPAPGFELEHHGNLLDPWMPRRVRYTRSHEEFRAAMLKQAAAMAQPPAAEEIAEEARKQREAEQSEALRVELLQRAAKMSEERRRHEAEAEASWAPIEPDEETERASAGSR